MILERPKTITIVDEVLNALLDRGLYLKDRDQLLYFARKYAKNYGIKYTPTRNFLIYLLENIDIFINFMIVRYG